MGEQAASWGMGMAVEDVNSAGKTFLSFKQPYAIHKMYVAERKLKVVRLLVVLFVTLAWMALPEDHPHARVSGPLLIFIYIYSLGIFFLEPYRRFPLAFVSIFTASADAMLAFAWIYSTGGASSLYHFVLYGCLIGVGYRFSALATLIIAGICIMVYIAAFLFLDQIEDHVGVVLYRAGFMLIIAAGVIAVTRESQEHIQARLDMEALAEKASAAEAEVSRANAVLEATISERTAQLEESVQRFRMLLETMPQLAWAADQDGNISYFNHAAREFAGCGTSETWRWDVMLHPADKFSFGRRWLKALKSNSSFEAECRWKRSDGQERWMLIRANPFPARTGGVCLWICTATDIHEQKMTEQELERRVHDRTTALSVLNKELERSNSDLEQFAFVASHDLKEPLRMVSNFSDLLLKHLNTTNDALVAEYAAYMKDGVHRMRLLIDGLLAYSCIGRQDEHFTQVNMEHTMEQVLDSMRFHISKCGAEVAVEKLPVLNAVPHLLYQLLYALLDNSLKFCHADIRPQISISATEVVLPGGWQFRIRDNGLGIPEEYREKVFQIFQRLHGRHHYAGTGVGLAICKRIVEIHGGRIRIESCEGGGTCIVFTLGIFRV